MVSMTIILSIQRIHEIMAKDPWLTAYCLIAIVNTIEDQTISIPHHMIAVYYKYKYIYTNF